jgi:hypothetical protein
MTATGASGIGTSTAQALASEVQQLAQPTPNSRRCDTNHHNQELCDSLRAAR